MVGRECRLELGVIEREQRRYRSNSLAARRTAAVLVTRGLLEFGKAFEAKCLAESHHRARGRARPPREFLGCLERRLVEVIDDVLRHILLRARELVEPSADV